MALKSDIEETILCFLRRGRPLTHQQLGKELKASQPTVRRRVASLRERGWLLNELGGLGRDQLMLNLNRSGFDAFAEYLYIEHGVPVAPYRRALDKDGRFSFHGLHHTPARKAPAEQVRLGEIASHAERTAEVVSELRGRDVRQYMAEARGILSLHARIESKMQRMYRHPHAERARDFVHLMIHLGEDLLPGAPEDSQSPRETLVYLALSLRYNAAVYERYARRVNTAAQLGALRSEVTDRLAGWAMNHALPGTALGGGFLYGDQGLARESEWLRAIDQEMYGRHLVNHGGSPGPVGAGHGGDLLVAQQLFDAVADLIALIEEIKELPSMEAVFNDPDVAAEFDQGPHVEYPVDGYYLPKAEVPRREGDFENTGDKVPAPPEGTPVEELDGDLLRRGDQLVRVHDRPVPGEPVVAFNDGKHLRLIYEGFFGVSVATHEFTAGVPCAVRRGTDEVARTHPPEDQD